MLLWYAGEGLITYMRTDGVNLSAEAVGALRELIGSQYGAEYLPPAGARVYKSRAKNAQEAHEAIRPTDPSLLPAAVQGLTPDEVRGGKFTPTGVSSQREVQGWGDRRSCT